HLAVAEIRKIDDAPRQRGVAHHPGLREVGAVQELEHGRLAAAAAAGDADELALPDGERNVAAAFDALAQRVEGESLGEGFDFEHVHVRPHFSMKVATGPEKSGSRCCSCSCVQSHHFMRCRASTVAASNRSRTKRAGTPTTTVYGATSLVTTAPDPMTAPSPTT